MKNFKMKKEFKVIADLLPSNTRVLDVGCGDGSLMNLLYKKKNIEVRGLELDQNNVQQCIHKGLPVIQGDAETELHQFPNQSFDYVVLSQTLQAFYNPEKVLKELLRIGNSVIISIPAFTFLLSFMKFCLLVKLFLIVVISHIMCFLGFICKVLFCISLYILAWLIIFR